MGYDESGFDGPVVPARPIECEHRSEPVAGDRLREALVELIDSGNKAIKDPWTWAGELRKAINKAEKVLSAQPATGMGGAELDEHVASAHLRVRGRIG